jgi:hypothetical protein
MSGILVECQAYSRGKEVRERSLGIKILAELKIALESWPLSDLGKRKKGHVHRL